MALTNSLGGQTQARTAFTQTALNGGLVSDTNLLAGASLLAVDLTTLMAGSLPADLRVSGTIRGPAVAPTTNRNIEIWIYGDLTDTPTYPNGLGADALVTITTDAMKRGGGMWLGQTILVDAATTNVDYAVNFSVLQRMGAPPYLLAKRLGLFVVHNLGQTLGGVSSLGYQGLDGAY